TDVRFASGLAPINRPLRFEAQVSNFGTVEARAVRVSLRVDDEQPSDETTIESIGPGQSKSVSMFAKLRTAGSHTVTASVPGDHLRADDPRPIGMRGTEKIKVLLIDGRPAAPRTAGQMFFLRNALVPVPPAEAEGYFIAAATIPAADII